MTNMNPPFPDNPQTERFQYDQWRIKFLSLVLKGISALGLVLIIAVLPSATNSELLVFGAFYLALLVAAFAPLPYSIKAGMLLIIGSLVGLFALLRYGPWSDASVFMLATIVFASLLFDKPVDRWIFALNLLALAILGTMNVTGNLSLTADVPPLNAFGWLTYTADYAVLAIASMLAINLLKKEFKLVAARFQSAIDALSNERTNLEQNVEQRTAGLQKKSDQLSAASYIARRTAEALDIGSLLETVVRLVTDQFGFYHTGIFLLNETGEEAVLQAASSEGGRRMMEKGHSLKVGEQGIVGFAVAQKKPRIALDVGADAVFFDNPELPKTRSEMALPLMIRDRVLGVLDIQSDKPQEFSTDDIDVLQTLADQIAVAIENARLLDESQTALMQLEAVTAVRTREAWNQRIQRGGYAYTFTPLGIHAGTASIEADQTLQVPITLRGQKLGTIALARKDGTSWSKSDEELVNEVAYQTGLALDNIRLLEEATQRARQEQTVGELATRFSQSLDIDALLQTAARELGQVPDVAEVSVFIGQIPEQAPDRRRARRSKK
ncbi:MAG: hypothetical protein C3F07_01610 [Anaerolineales bacterium]|nr:MAG: hypothetical protein C3F07_01610 [Anaerolineales bacterium]